MCGHSHPPLRDMDEDDERAVTHRAAVKRAATDKELTRRIRRTTTTYRAGMDDETVEWLRRKRDELH